VEEVRKRLYIVYPIDNQGRLEMTEKHSKVRWDKTLKNYRDNYSYEQEWEIAILELIANSIDAKATTIKIFFSKNGDYATIICTDNGKGMDEIEFEEYHNLGSLTKSREEDTIGFAGIGAKLTLDLCKEVYTETRKDGKTLASIWWFDKDENEPKYIDDIESQNKLEFVRGTYVEIRNILASDITENKVKYLIYYNYQYLLDQVDIYVNDENLPSPIKLLRDVAKKSREIRDPTRRYKGMRINFVGEIFYLNDEGIKKINDFYEKETGKTDIFKNWFDIVVCGKTVIREEDFKLTQNVPREEWELIRGYIKCDDLISVVRTSKDDINRKSIPWKKFSNTAKLAIIKWLNEEGLYREYEHEKSDKVFQRMIKNLEKDINDLLNQYPDLLNKILTPGIKPLKPKKEENMTQMGEIPIPDSEGRERGSLELGGEMGTGVYGGTGHSPEPTVPHPGESGEIESGRWEGENIPITPKIKRVSRYKIGISWSPLEIKDPIIWDQSLNSFIINSNHPAAILARKDTKSRMFYTIHEILRYIAENYIEVETEEDKQEKFWELYDNYLKMPS
jgi:anti-sigma regulatory factor (Ser/Thr protein kinase)